MLDHSIALGWNASFMASIAIEENGDSFRCIGLIRRFESSEYNLNHLCYPSQSFRSYYGGLGIGKHRGKYYRHADVNDSAV